MKKLRLFPKTFLYCLCLITCILLIAFVLTYYLLPVKYQEYRDRELKKNAGSLVSELKDMQKHEMESYLLSSRIALGYGISLIDENGKTVVSKGIDISIMFDEKDDMAGTWMEANAAVKLKEYSVDFTTSDGRNFCLILLASMEPVEDAMRVILSVFPMVLVICIALSVGVSYLYTKDIYRKLYTVISELEQESSEVGRAEHEKLRVILMASHELKTPVTAVRGMVDGMLYQVGVYKDRTCYLQKCQEELERLSDMLKDLFNIAKTWKEESEKEKSEFFIDELVSQVVKPYQIIAETKGVLFELKRGSKSKVTLQKELLGKAISNVISNAVQYTDPGKRVTVLIKSDRLIIENECEPLQEEELAHVKEPFVRGAAELSKKNCRGDDGNGIGLYFVDQILSICRIPYHFLTYEKGMRFIMEFGTKNKQ
ncbi:MAG: HAMP domain-containing histidine kinase [Lachnospiraceae bacterium]|nr:HAMP domain-containing histidine kinase [Lachnospiraceae bacterium]